MPHKTSEARRAYNKEYNKNLSPAQREIKRLRTQKHCQDNPEYYKEWRRNNVASRLCSTAKARALKRGMVFDLAKDDFEVPSHCPVLGIPLEVHIDGGSGGKDNSYSLDRIDQSLGYIKGNVQVISHKANSMKFTASREELLKFAEWIHKTYD